MLKQIETALKAVDNNVFYGGVTGIDRIDKWDYIVFGRRNLRRNTKGNTSYTHVITVSIVREEYVPEETIYEVIEAMESIPGVRLEDDGGTFAYDRKEGTKAIMEIAQLTFTWARKRCST